MGTESLSFKLKGIFMSVRHIFLSISLMSVGLFGVFGFSSVGFEEDETPGRRQFLVEPPELVDSKVKVAFFDADSTLRVSKSGTVSANHPDDYIILPGVVDYIRHLNSQNYLVVIVSNQGGVSRGLVSLEVADTALWNLTVDLFELGAIVHYYDFAENYDDNRKPDTGMAKDLEVALREHFGSEVVIDKENSFMVGDSAYKRARRGKPADRRPDGRLGFNFSNSDRYFAENYGVDFFEPQKVFGWEEYGVELIANKEDLERLLQAMD